jgi:hypothetical protein
VKVLKKHLKNLTSATVYPNCIIYYFETYDNKLNIKLEYCIKVIKAIPFYQNNDDLRLCNTLCFYFYHSQKPIEPTKLIDISNVSIYPDNSSNREKKAGIRHEYLKVFFSDNTFIFSQKYILPDEMVLHGIDMFSYHYSSNLNPQLNNCIHTIDLTK